MRTLDWTRIIASVVLLGWGLLGLYSGIKNDGKSRFLMLGGLGYLLDKAEDQKTAIRIKNIILGILTAGLGGALLCAQLK